jgi:hypothetical protein
VVQLPPLRCFISSGRAPLIWPISERRRFFSRLLPAAIDDTHMGARGIRAWNVWVLSGSN